MITVTVKLFASLKEGRFDRKDFQCAEKSSVRDVLNSAGIGDKEYHIAFVNNRHAPPEQELRDGDILGIFPAVGGG